MARFYGEIGYGQTVETSPGVHQMVITERQYYGDVLRESRQLKEGEGSNMDLKLSNRISIVADAYAEQHFHAIRYVRWAGTLWIVTDVTVQRPRLIMRLGGVYDGPTA